MENLQDISKRLQALEDIEAIKNLHREYVYWINSRQWDKTTDCFTEDAIAVIFRHPRAAGIDQIRSLFFDGIGKVNAGKGRDAHFATMPVIRLNGSQASGHWMLYIFIADPITGNALRWTQGRYECEYRKVTGQWKFSKLVWVNPWPRQPESLPKVEDLKDLNLDI
jgi:ketosteroid isomerase-like protein